ncbi:hypothetical protein F-VV63_0364 [Faustovirus]|nr:hypothetical protein F-VV63_0364 [Faustovirus]
MTLYDMVEFYAACLAVVFEWLEPKFTLVTVIMVMSMRNIFGVSDDATMAALIWLHIAYMALAVISLYVNRVLVPREKINVSIQCS